MRRVAPGRRKEPEKEVPDWKKQLDADDGDEEEENDDSGPLPEPAQPPAPQPVSEHKTPKEEEAEEDDDDDDDENFDPRNYDLGAMSSPERDAEPQAAEPTTVDGSLSGTPACIVSVANLAFETRVEALADFLASCGRIVDIQMHDAEHSKRTAMVTFATEACAQRALRLTGKHMPTQKNSRPLTLLLSPIGSTPADDGLNYDLLRNSVTVRRGRVQPTPAPSAIAVAAVPPEVGNGARQESSSVSSSSRSFAPLPGFSHISGDKPRANRVVSTTAQDVDSTKFHFSRGRAAAEGAAAAAAAAAAADATFAAQHAQYTLPPPSSAYLPGGVAPWAAPLAYPSGAAAMAMAACSEATAAMQAAAAARAFEAQYGISRPGAHDPHLEAPSWDGVPEPKRARQ